MEGGDADDPPGLMEQFIQQFYDDAADVPRTLVVQHAFENTEVVEDWLAQKRGRKVSIISPQRGGKRRMVEMAADNALEGLNQRRIKWLSESDKVLQALNELQEALNLPELPDRIECYDISNIQGTHSVGSMVVFEEGRPRPSHYRRFQIRGVEGIDDYASMQEMLRRRFKRLGALRTHEAEVQGDDSGETSQRYRARRAGRVGALAPDHLSGSPEGGRNAKQESFGLVPGLVIIDGGKGHLNAVQQVFLELGITDVPLCSLAKQEEEVFLPHVPEPVILPRQSQSLYLVQRVRDEAHRFAITYHRQRRSKEAIRSALDEAPGIGPKRKRELLRRFANVGGVRAAALAEIASVPGMSESSARKLAEHLGGDVGQSLTKSAAR
jgi:excinuclease ABC subunit C